MKHILFNNFSKPTKVIDAWKGFIAITAVIEEGWDLPTNRLSSTVITI